MDIYKPKAWLSEKADIDYYLHNEAVNRLWADFEQKNNERVPAVFAYDEQLLIELSGDCSYKKFYTDPVINARVNLDGLKWTANNIVADRHIGQEPGTLTIPVWDWMMESKFFGCEIQYQENERAWGRPIDINDEDLLGYIEDIDPEDALRRTNACRMYFALSEYLEGKTYEGHPLQVGNPLLGTHGPFTKLIEIIGMERVMYMMADNRDLVVNLLLAVVEKTIERMKAAYTLLGQQPPAKVPFGIGCDDSLMLISAADYLECVYPCYKYFYENSTASSAGIHLCGKAAHLYKTLYEHIGLRSIDGPGVFCDHGKFLAELPDFVFRHAQFNHSVFLESRENILKMVQGLMTPGAKQPGRFSLMGMLQSKDALQNILYCYDMVKQYGKINL